MTYPYAHTPAPARRAWYRAALGALLLTLGCGGGGGGGGGNGGGGNPVEPVTDNLSIAAASAVTQSASIGGPARELPAVKVTDGTGAAKAGVTVTFAVTAGAGAITGASPQTGADGIARLGGWTMGPGTAQNSVSASIPNKTPVVFTASVPSGLQKVEGDAQTGLAGSRLAPFVVRVTDTGGSPVPDVPVTFAVAQGGGTLSGLVANTGADGTARTQLTMGTTAGVHSVTATAPGMTPVAFTATATPGVAVSLQKTGGDFQRAPAGSALPQPLVVKAVDASGNGVPGVPVTFSAVDGATLSTTQAATDADGTARTQVTLRATAGSNQVRAMAPGLTAAVFEATGEAGAATRLVIHAGDNQAGTVGVRLPNSVVVRVLDANDNPVSGVNIAYAVTTGGGSLDQQSDRTDVTGLGVASWTLGRTAGEQTMTATAPGMAPVTIKARASAGPTAALLVVGGNNQRVVVGTAPAERLRIRAVDVYGNHKMGVPITFTSTPFIGITRLGTVTDPDGYLEATVEQLPTLARGYTIWANSPGVNSSQLSLTGVPAAAASIAISGGNAQTADEGTVLPLKPTVVVKDQHGNLKNLAEVVFAPAAGDGTADPVRVTTGGDGQAATTWTLGDDGPATMTATVEGLPPVTFTATANYVNPACVITPDHAVGTTVNGELTTADCQGPRTGYVDRFRLTNVPSMATFTLASPVFSEWMVIRDARGFIVAEATPVGTQTSVAMSLVGATNGYTVEVMTNSIGIYTGAYQLGSSAVNTLPGGCARNWLVLGFTVSGTLQADDCLNNATGVPNDEYRVYAPVPMRLIATATHTAQTALSARVQIVSLASGLVADGFGTASVSVSPGTHIVRVGLPREVGFGNYTLRVSTTTQY